MQVLCTPELVIPRLEGLEATPNAGDIGPLVLESPWQNWARGDFIAAALGQVYCW